MRKLNRQTRVLPFDRSERGHPARRDFEGLSSFGVVPCRSICGRAAAWKAALRHFQLSCIAKRSVQMVVAVVCLLEFAMPALGQEVPADRVSVPFRDPSRPGLVKVNLMMGGITVKGYDGKEVIVETRLRGSNGSKKESRNGEGLKRLEISATGLTVEEEDNVVTVSTGPMGKTADLMIQVPLATSLKLGCLTDGNILVEKVEGEIEANNLNGPVTLTNVSGVVIAHSLNGAVVTHLEKATPDKPMSFSTMNGDIDVTLPPATKANVKLETQNGKIYSDFEIETKGGGPQVIRSDKGVARRDNRQDVLRFDGKHLIRFDKGIVGSINGGGPEFRFKTLNGNIHIRKGK